MENPVIKNYPYIENLNKNPSTIYKWSISGFNELIDFIKSVRAEKKNFFELLKPKVICIFPEDIFESERVFLRTVFEDTTREIYFFESFQICQLNIFTISNIVGKKVLSLGERMNQSYREVENSINLESKIYEISDKEIYDLEFDLIISHKPTDKTNFKSKLFLEGEELRMNLIGGCKKLLELRKID
ncbi:MAG: hypothetical protein KDK36_03680 [Leptospiraceae bacterium]|nr:hypothetical protein [Leptospiraceae bacterium]